jgi:putative N-acetylmannosamine-6-phosphate epimerase/N-acetylglucosamine kinase-like BadF-type ATPase
MTAAGGPRWVAIDGGQSGLRLTTGSLSGRGPGFSYRGADPVGGIADAVRAAARDAGLTGPVDVACLGLTGYPNRPQDVSRLADAVAHVLGATEIRICEDMVTAHAGALPDGVGVVVAAGSGVVCLAIGSDGQIHKVDGGGYLFGDVGSGFAIGRSGIRAVVAARDGRARPTALTARAESFYGSVRELTPKLYVSPSVVGDVAGFATEVFAAAAEGDTAALAIVRDAAAGLAHSIIVTVRRLSRTEPVTVAYTGGLFDAGEILLEPIRKRLAEILPTATFVPAAGTPLDGARQLAQGPLSRYAPLVRVFHPTALPAVSTVDDLPFPAGSLVVSCQAWYGNPLRGPEPMSLMAAAAAAGGALGIRANGPADVAAIRSTVDLPIIGINKLGDPGGVYITPTAAAAAEVVRAGASVVAIDGTNRKRPDGSTLAEQISSIHNELGVLVMADVDTLKAGIAARQAGADLVATTLSGYTGGPVPDGPDVDLVAALAERLDCPVLAEGRYWTPEQVREAIAAGAYAVIVGTAITNPMAITTRLLKAMQ